VLSKSVARDKLLWFITLASAYEWGFKTHQQAREDALLDGDVVELVTDWRLIQQRLMPEVFLVLGTVSKRRTNQLFPFMVVVPAFSEYWKCTSDEELDILKRDISTLTDEDNSEFRLLETRVRRIPEKNPQRKGIRLLEELEKLLKQYV
jgi:hypothetical protein